MEYAKKEHPQGLKENLNVAKRGGNVSKMARETYEKEAGDSAITNKNAINGRYIDDSYQLKENSLH